MTSVTPAVDGPTKSRPRIVLDGAHNGHGARALAATWRESFGEEKAVIIFGAFFQQKRVVLHLGVGLLAALHQSRRTGEGQYVEVAMMDGVMNLCRVKFRDHQRLTRQALSEYSVPTYMGMGDVPRAGNDSGGGQLGNAIHCKPHGSNDCPRPQPDVAAMEVMNAASRWHSAV